MSAEKSAKPPEGPPAEAEGSAKKGGKKTILVAAVVVLLEAGTVGVTMMMAGGPRRAAADPPATAPKVVEKDAEVKIVDAKLPNAKGGLGHLYLYDLQVVAKVADKDKDKVADLLTERDAQIKDHIRTIIAGFDPQSLAEPGLETLRRQIAYQLDQDIGKDLVKEVLIPKCTPIRADY
ncbi:MAG TPA: hypothetical protein VHQ47_00770 [Phycisphaerae bacterium]|jgi:flagellar basal body-associated protein FliL|nr:hypothetical protein [Phycisphaerae bacterium]